MDRFNGLLAIAESLGVVTKTGAWYTFSKTGDKFQSKNFSKYQDDILDECEKLASSVHLEAIIADDVESEDVGDGKTMKARRKEKFDENILLEDD